MPRQDGQLNQCQQICWIMLKRSSFYFVVSVLITAVIVLQAMLLPDVASDINDHIEAVEIGADMENTDPEFPQKTIPEMLDECNFMKPITATTCGVLGSAAGILFLYKRNETGNFREALKSKDGALHVLFFTMMLLFMIVTLLTSWNTIAEARLTATLLIGLLVVSLGVSTVFIFIQCWPKENYTHLINQDVIEEGAGISPAAVGNWAAGQNALDRQQNRQDSDQDPAAELNDQHEIRPVAPVVRPDAIVVHELHSVNPISEIVQQVQPQPWSPSPSGSNPEDEAAGNNIRRRMLEQLHKL